VTDYRVTLMIEGEATADGLWVKPGALTWSDPIPLTGLPREDGSVEVYGLVSSVERLDDGRIVGTVSLVADPPHAGIGADLEQAAWLITSPDDPLARIGRGRIHALRSVPTPAWAQAVIER
jgi:hypothetical protein